MKITFTIEADDVSELATIQRVVEMLRGVPTDVTLTIVGLAPASAPVEEGERQAHIKAKVHAIKTLRDVSNLCLADAKRMVEDWYMSLGKPFDIKVPSHQETQVRRTLAAAGFKLG